MGRNTPRSTHLRTVEGTTRASLATSEVVRRISSLVVICAGFGVMRLMVPDARRARNTTRRDIHHLFRLARDARHSR